MNGLETIARQSLNNLLHNVLNTRRVNLFFNRSAGDDAGGDRAIAGLNFQVRAQGFIIQSGQTAADGRIAMSIRGGSSTLEILHNATVVARYEVKASSLPLVAANTVTGQKQRLRLLGYQIGHTGPDGNGVDANTNADFERSMLDFQADESLYDDAVVNPATQNQLTTRAGV